MFLGPSLSIDEMEKKGKEGKHEDADCTLQSTDAALRSSSWGHWGSRGGGCHGSRG